MKRPIIVLVVAAGVLAAGVLAAGERTPLKEKFPEAGEVIPLIEDFPLLKNLLELDDPWKESPVTLKDKIFPKKLELIYGSEAYPLLYVDRRHIHDWQKIGWGEYKQNQPADWSGLKVFEQWSYVTDYYVFDPARPKICLHLGRPALAFADCMKTLYPPIADSVREHVPGKLESVVEALEPYGAKRLPFKHKRIRKYLLPGGTKLTFCDYSKTAVPGKHNNYLQIQIEPAAARDARMPLPAFPGAEGFGSYSLGGRGGKVYLVTTLEDYLPRGRPGRKAGTMGQHGKGLPGYPALPKESVIHGSLREAIEAEGPRIILFAVSGTIKLKSPLVIRNPYVTIAGHTAPGQGVQIRNWGIYVYTHDVILRYLRLRVGDIKGPDGMPRVLGDQTWAMDIIGMNVIVDHCECAYANDQIVNIHSCYPASAGKSLVGIVRTAVSYQWNYTYGGPRKSTHEKGDHSMGFIMDGFGGLSFHHNLTAHTSRRHPRLTALPTDWRNNVLYDYEGTGYGSQPDFLAFNYIANVQKRGKNKHAFISKGSVAARFYGADNVIENQGDTPLFIVPDEAIMDQPWDAMPVKTDPAMVAYEKVLKYGGADLPVRDVITEYVARSVRTNSGSIPDRIDDWFHGGYAGYEPAEPAPDADRDGMPDWWEKKFGLDPHDASDNAGDKDGDGYTNVEEFINDTDPTEFIDYRKPENNVHSLHREDTIHRRKK